MKGFVKTIIAGAVIIGLGVAILLITLGINGWNINVALGNSNFEMKTYNAVNSVETLKVDFYAGSLEIEFYDGDEVKIEYPENKKYSAEINEENGVLSMSTGSRHWYDWFLNWSIINLPATKISLPADSKIMEAGCYNYLAANGTTYQGYPSEAVFGIPATTEHLDTIVQFLDFIMEK